jgi:apolipoprotein N-acyltransferase
VPLLVGGVLSGPGPYVSNAGIVWLPRTGPDAMYLKRHPVPFAEYIPYRSFFRLFSDKVDLVARDFAPGREVGVLRMGPAAVGDVICFEVAYDGLVRDTVRAGADLVVVQTNNATFGYTAQSEQQLAMSRLRAVEHGRSVAVAATSGISAIVAPDGTVVRSSALFTPEVFVAEIAQRDSRSVADRVGSGPEWLLTALGIAALGSALLLRRSRRRAAGAG